MTDIAAGWVDVKDRLPEPVSGKGSYEAYGTDVVVVLHRDRPDYPVTAHAFLGECVGLGIRVPTAGASQHRWIAWYSVGLDLCNPFSMATTPEGQPFKDSAGYSRFLPNYFGRGITHWAPISTALRAEESK